MKNVVNRSLVVLFFVCICAWVVGCSLPSNSDVENPDNSNGFTLVEELFVEEADGDYTVTRVHTNEPKYWGYDGYTLWTKWPGGESQTFQERTVFLSKSAGVSYAGYGLIICEGEREVDGVMENTMLTVMINNEGQYSFGKVIGGRYTNLQWWDNTPYLEIGPGQPNKITVTYDEGTNTFSLIINDRGSIQFQDQHAPVHTTGRNGYIVVISPNDRFPNTDVDVYFREKK